MVGSTRGDQTMSDYGNDFRQRLRDDVNKLMLRVKSGELSRQEAEHEIDLCFVLSELLPIWAEMGPWPCSPQEQMRREDLLIELWPEACRRVGISVMPMPHDIIPHLNRFAGRAS
jgi:hypothetical protein